MAKEDTPTEYFLVRRDDCFFRIGVQGNKEAIYESLLKEYDSVEYIDLFRVPIYTDIDTDVGLGNRRIDGGVVVTCKFVFMLMTSSSGRDFFDYLRTYHKGLKRQVKERYEGLCQLKAERAARKAEKEDKKQRAANRIAKMKATLAKKKAARLRNTI